MSEHPVALTAFLNALVALAFLIANESGWEVSGSLVAGVEAVLNTGIALFARSQGPANTEV